MTSAQIDQVARALWATEVKEQRRRQRRPLSFGEREPTPGYPRTWWDRALEGDSFEYAESYQGRAEHYMDSVREAFDLNPLARQIAGREAGWFYGAFDGGYADALRWMEVHAKTLWYRFNAQLVEQHVPPGRGLGGPLYPNEWWYDYEWVIDEHGMSTGQREYTLRIPEPKLPARFEDRAVFLSLVHIRGATARWRYRRDQGRSDEDFLTDVAMELGTVGGIMMPWQGEWERISFNGHGQEAHGYSKKLGIRWGPWTADQKRLPEPKIVRMARRLFKVPTLYAAGVDEDTGQAAFF